MGQQPWSKHFASASSFNACATAMVTQATLHMFASFSWPKWHQTVHRPAPAKGSLRFIINDGLSMTARQSLSSMPEKDWSCGGAICHQPMVPPTSIRRKSRIPCRLSADQTLAGAKWFTAEASTWVFQKSNQVPFGLRSSAKKKEGNLPLWRQMPWM